MQPCPHSASTLNPSNPGPILFGGKAKSGLETQLCCCVIKLQAQAINRSAEVIECTNSDVDLGRILGISAFSLDKMLTQDPHFLVGHHCALW